MYAANTDTVALLPGTNYVLTVNTARVIGFVDVVGGRAVSSPIVFRVCAKANASHKAAFERMLG